MTQPDDRTSSLRDQIHILEAIEAAFTRWPEVSAAAYEADTENDFQLRIRALLSLDELQAEAVSDQSSRHASKAGRARLERTLTEARAALLPTYERGPSSA